MPGPKNNLAEILSPRDTSASASVHLLAFSPRPATPATSAMGKRSKFKPATNTTSGPNNSAPNKTSTTNIPPSFSAGFQCSSANNGSTSISCSNVHESAREVSTRANAVKRTSSDPSVSSDPSPQSLKKLKQNKENLDLHSKPIVQCPLKYNTTGVGDTVNKPVEYDPWADLDRDYPLSPEIPKEKDLLMQSENTLNEYRTHCLGLHHMISNQLLSPEPSNTPKDTVVIRNILNVINDRIKDIELALKAKKVDKISATGLECTAKPSPAVVISKPHREQYESVYSSTSDQQSKTPEFVTGSSKPTPSVEIIQTVDDDSSYWETFPDFDMDHDFPAYVEGPSASLPVSAVNVPHSPQHSAQLSQTRYYPEIMSILRNIFGLQEFRKNQLEAITSTMEGYDVFVLMPTGGGKSLCYQLPAVCRSGETKGLTVVVTPLVALMQDQVSSLLKKGISAFLWNSDTPPEDVNQFLNGQDYKGALLYVTPEKLKESNKLKNTLAMLYRQNELARFVVDEAHCISTWGQDFREAYQNLGTLRDEYPRVPIMALTATANLVTIEDIKKQLKIPDCKCYQQSFNRPNLRYFIKEKKKKTLVEDIAAYIKLNHRGEPGVIYCTGRETCERVASKLMQHGLRATHYHAKLTPDIKNRTLIDWQNGTVDIIVATIAFGMGIDKADVRFVIHHDLAKSLSGYYQETGRAGRDGKPADCILYYSYQDFHTICRMIRDSKDRETAISPQAIKRQEDAARDVVQYCENSSDCRRVQLLQFFGEKFDSKDCANGCDNCADTREVIIEDVTAHARNAITLVQSLNAKGENITVNQLQNVLRGANTSDIREKGHDKSPLYGSAKDVPKELLEKLVRHLLYRLQILEVFAFDNGSGYHTEYLKLSGQGLKILQKTAKIELGWRPKTRGSRKKKVAPGTSEHNISVTSKGKQAIPMETEDPIELYDEDDSPVSHERSPDNEEIEIIDLSHDGPEVLYKKMKSLSNRVVGVNDQYILNDTALQYLSALCPVDYVGFKRCLNDALEDVTPCIEERKRSVDEIYNKYGQQFLNLCIDHKMKRKDKDDTAITPVIDTNWKLQFEYRTSSFGPSSSSSVTRRNKFKPA